MHLSLASVLHESALRHADAVAAIEGPRSATFAELWELALARAGALREAGVAPGDRVALLAHNTIDFVTAYYGILARGAVVVPVAPMLVRGEIAHLLGDSGAALALAGDDLADLLGPAAREAGVPHLALGDAAALAAPEDGLTLRHPFDPAVIFSTSGTTAQPKGAVLTHLNLTMNAFVNAFIHNAMAPGEVTFACLPLFHIFGQTVALNATLLAGARVVLQPRFEPVEALELMGRHRVTAFLGVPTMYIALLAAVREGAPVPRLRLCLAGGAPLPDAVREAFDATFGVRIQEGYGLSETSPVATVNQPELGLVPHSVGQPIWGVQVGVAEAEVEDRVLLREPGDVGEIVIRGHNVFAGYHGRPEATAAALVDGWFRTGDLGTVDAAGTVRLVDRKKDIILRGGFTVGPREIEEMLSRHPGVEQVAVVGIPHPTHGEEILAVVVPTAPPPDADALLAWAAERLAAHKRPRLVTFVDELPLGPSRKVLKRELRARYATLATG
jgi:long-chain acyl-CoA synthetase